MCKITHKIKFYTCAPGKKNQLKNYWALYRYNKSKDTFILGTPIMPEDDANFELNDAILMQRLSEPDAFDIPLEFKAKDKFVVVIHPWGDERFQAYAFKYKRKQWVPVDYDPFEYYNQHDEVTKGEIQDE